MKVYQVITNNKYELPIFQGDTIEEVAWFLNKTCQSVRQTIAEGYTILGKKYRIIAVELDDEE